MRDVVSMLVAESHDHLAMLNPDKGRELSVRFIALRSLGLIGNRIWDDLGFRILEM